MKKLFFALLLCALAACSNYREPKANCFAFVSQGPSLLTAISRRLADQT